MRNSTTSYRRPGIDLRRCSGLRRSGDRYTFFAPPQVATYDRQTLAREFGGIGAYVGQDADGQLITALLQGSRPRSRLAGQDVIEEIDGVSIAGWTLKLPSDGCAADW